MTVEPAGPKMRSSPSMRSTARSASSVVSHTKTPLPAASPSASGVQQPANIALVGPTGGYRVAHVVLADQPRAGCSPLAGNVCWIGEEHRRVVVELPRFHRVRPRSVHLLRKGEKGGRAGA